MACVALVLAPTLQLLVGPAVGEGAGTAAAVALVAAVLVVSAVALHSFADALGILGAGVLSGPRGEDQHRSGIFRRQHAPQTPGRPGRPRAPGRIPVGLTR
jgi:hypothetical protein